MKLLNQTYTWRCALLIIAAFGITSCASTGMQRSQDTQTTMETMDNDIQEASRQLDATGASLDELIKPGQTDITHAFESYKNNVGKMESMEKKFAKHAEQMKAKGIDYFDEWQKEGTEYKNLQIQYLSDERRAALGEIYDKIAGNSIAVNDSTITAFKAQMANETADVKAAYEKQLAVLEKKNSDMKKKLADYKGEGKEQWETFKAAFNREMNTLGEAFENLTDTNS